jgi:hypothetical protein
VLYLLKPPMKLMWEDYPAEPVLTIARERNDVDLARLDWKPSERPLTTDGIRVALRHGVRCSTGIVVEGIHLVELSRAGELRQLAVEGQAARAALAPHDALMEKISPGWTEHGRELDARIAATMDEAVREAQEEAAELLAAPVQPELSAHWRSLGGVVPNPE